MKNFLKKVLVLFCCGVAFNVNAQQFEWVKNPGSNAVDVPYRVAIDASGNAYYTGALWNSGGNHSLCNNTVSNVLMKYNSSGTCQWQISIAGKGTGVAYYNNNIYVCGYSGTPAGIGDMFVSKYDLSGNQVGTTYYATSTGTSPSSIEAYGISVTSDGVFVCGSVFKEAVFYSQPNYGGSTTNVSIGANRFGIFVMKLDASTLNLSWQNMPTSTGDAEAYAVTSSTFYHTVHITGYFKGSATFGSLSAVTSVGGSDMFLAKVDQSTGATWGYARTGGSTNVLSFDRGTDILVSPLYAGLLFVCGTFTSSGTIGATTVTGGWMAKYTTSAGAQSGVVATGAAEAQAISIDPTTSHVYVGGTNAINKYDHNLNSVWGIPIVNSNTFISGLASNGCSTYFIGSLYFPPSTCSLVIGPATLSNFAMSCNADRDLLIGRVTNGFTITTTGTNCVSTSFPLNATTGYTTYTWTPNIGSSASVTANPCTDGSNTYTVVGSTGTCSNTATITVKPKPSVSINAGNCNNIVPWLFTATPSCNISPTTYLWYKNNISTGSTGSTYNATTGGSYKVVMTSGTGCSATSNTSVIDCFCCRLSNEDADKFSVYPEPSNGNFIVTGLSSGDLIRIINIDGKEVYRSTVTNDGPAFELQLPSVETGIYFVKIENAITGINEVRKIQIIK